MPEWATEKKIRKIRILDLWCHALPMKPKSELQRKMSTRDPGTSPGNRIGSPASTATRPITWNQSEPLLDTKHRRGSRSINVDVKQEWLNLHGPWLNGLRRDAGTTSTDWRTSITWHVLYRGTVTSLVMLHPPFLINLLSLFRFELEYNTKLN